LDQRHVLSREVFERLRCRGQVSKGFEVLEAQLLDESRSILEVAIGGLKECRCMAVVLENGRKIS